MEQTAKLKEFAKDNAVPIIKDPSLTFITDYIKSHNVHSMLEIGSAIGYSAINFAKAADDIFVDTFFVPPTTSSYTNSPSTLIFIPFAVPSSFIKPLSKKYLSETVNLTVNVFAL